MFFESLITQISILLILLFFSSFFSSSETALFSLSRAKLLAFRTSKERKNRIITLLLDKYHTTLIVLILGNMFVNVTFSIVNNQIWENLHLSNFYTFIISGITSLILLLLLGEVTPKVIALTHSEGISRKVAVPIYYLSKILYPIIFIFDKICAFILDLLGRGYSRPLSQNEYKIYLELAENEGLFSTSEINLLEDIFDLREQNVSEIMISKMNTISLKTNMSYSEVVKIIKTQYQKYYSLIQEDIDDAETILDTKRFLTLPENQHNQWYEKIKLISPVFIPENTTITKALSSLKTKQEDVAFAIDEYGSIQGVLDVEDIYKRIMNDIEDNSKPKEDIKIEMLNKELILSGSVSIYALEELLNIKITEPINSNTLNGLITEKLDRIPVLGDKIIFNNMTFIVIKISKNRVSELKVYKEDL